MPQGKLCPSDGASPISCTLPDRPFTFRLQNGTNVKDNVGQIIPGAQSTFGTSTISSLRLPAGLYATCYSNDARVSYYEQKPQLAPQPYILSRRM